MSDARRDAIAGLGLPPVWPESPLREIARRFNVSGSRLIVLDDDPLGGQSIHGVPVLTRWDAPDLEQEMRDSRVFCLLTNTRALSRADALRRAREAGASIRDAAAHAGVEVIIASRGDSTLRGHFPAELTSIIEAMAGTGTGSAPAVIFAPYFGEAGRVTVGDVQYVLSDGGLTPVGETEYARDPMFRFQHSHLPTWLASRPGGSLRAEDVLSIGVAELRTGGQTTVARRLLDAPAGCTLVVNAVDDRDIEVFVAGLLDAEAAGRRFVYHCAAPFVRIRAGIAARPLLSSAEVLGEHAESGGGLTVVGSYIERTTSQLAYALARADVIGIEMPVDAVLEGGAASETAIARCVMAASAAFAGGRDVVLYTSRALRGGAAPDGTLAVGQRLSEALASIVSGLAGRPRYLMVKGGSTASQLATRALAVRRATILGQLQTGVPVWRLGEESRWPGLGLVIFAGNVGGRESLAQAILQLRRAP